MRFALIFHTYLNGQGSRYYIPFFSFKYPPRRNCQGVYMERESNNYAKESQFGPLITVICGEFPILFTHYIVDKA